MGKAELAMTPLQPWGEEAEEGAVYSIVLQRVRAEPEAHGPSPPVDPDLPGCPFVHYRTCKRRLLRAATLPALVRWLPASGAEGDPGFLPSFLATYQAFATQEQVLELLLPLWPDQAVLPVLELWLRDHPEDFWEPPEHPSLQRILLFLHRLARGSPACAAAESLLQAHKKQQEEEEEVAACGRDAAEADGAAPDVQESLGEPLLVRARNLQHGFSGIHWAGRAGGSKIGGEAPGVGPPEVTMEAAGPGAGKELPALLSFAVEEVAEQLTLMDLNLFRVVRPFHCLGCVWSQRDKKEKQHVAPSVRATVAQFNAVTSCVVTSVLEDLTLRVHQRAHLLEKWIDIAQHCRTLRNFSSLYAILSALQSNPIYRLKRTWAAVNRNARTSFHKLSEIFSEDNNHLNCREILLQDGGGAVSPRDGCSSPQMPARTPLKLSPPSRGTPPTVPYLGTFLTDLIMLDTALPDFMEGNLINFEKRRKEAETLALIRQLQESCRGYSLCPDPAFRSAFRGLQKLSEEQSYRISRVIEPPASSCPNSPKLHRSLTKRFSSLLLGSDASAPSPSPDRADVPPPGSFGGLHSGEGLGTSCCPAQGAPPCKDLPTPQRSPRPLRESASLPPPASSKHGGTESRIVRVSLDNGHGNLYRSIVITSQDKAAAVVRRALQKHNLGEASLHDYRLLQRLADGQELLIPSGANAFYAMNPASPCDFLLRHKEEAARPGSRATRPGTPTPCPVSPMALPAPSGPASPPCSAASSPPQASGSSGAGCSPSPPSSPPASSSPSPPSLEPFGPAPSSGGAASPLDRPPGHPHPPLLELGVPPTTTTTPSYYPEAASVLLGLPSDRVQPVPSAAQDGGRRSGSRFSSDSDEARCAPKLPEEPEGGTGADEAQETDAHYWMRRRGGCLLFGDKAA